jgi:hypothetical protein
VFGLTLNSAKGTVVTCATGLLDVSGHRVNLTFTSKKNSPEHEYTIKVRFKKVRANSFQWRAQKISLVRSQELRKTTRQYLHNFVDLKYDRGTQLKD